MECISISFKSAPEDVRKCFVFSEEEKKKILERTGQAVVLNTCNRTEIYAAGEETCFNLLEKLLAEKAGMEETQLRRISRRFQGKKALEHLYRVTCGMDSMVLGEDEILGQMRQAYLFSCKESKPGYELNTAFPGAPACAKRRKQRFPNLPYPLPRWFPMRYLRRRTGYRGENMAGRNGNYRCFLLAEAEKWEALSSRTCWIMEASMCWQRKGTMRWPDNPEGR